MSFTQTVLLAALAGATIFLGLPVGRLRNLSGEGPASAFIVDAVALVVSVSVGLLSVVWVTRRIRAAGSGAPDPRQIALGTAVGLGLHNFSEGLAIGQSAATGATARAILLVVGFAAHNATEGFGIAAPLTSGERPTWGFLAFTGLIGGGPTFAAE